MEYFLERIATHLFGEYGNSLEKQCLVFPNRRAGLYLIKYLSSQIKKPVWIPEIKTINELFGSFSSLHKVDNEILLFELYKGYKTLTKSAESFDDFYSWGEMLINDFDDVDKYMADASMLFRNINDLKEIDQKFGGLTDEQTELIKRFWINFNPDKQSSEKTGFMNVWSVLHRLYTDYRSSLAAKGICYEGMIYREVAEMVAAVTKPDIKWDTVHFIGFNALNTCERSLMSYLKKAGKARFYWDYDRSYITGDKLSSTGFFLKQNIKNFGNDMPSGWDYDTLLWNNGGNVRRRVIDASSDNAQVKLIPALLNNLEDISSENAHHTAVILADENLLLPLLSSMPEKTAEVNITMGYPLKQTPVYTLISQIISLQRKVRNENGRSLFHHKDVLAILKNQLISSLLNGDEKLIGEKIISCNQIWVTADLFKDNRLLNHIFQVPGTTDLFSGYMREILSAIAQNGDKPSGESTDKSVRAAIRNEFIYRIILSINRLEKALISGEIQIHKETYFSILDKVLRTQSVPFSGEPLSGIQIMGLLETRALDFRNLIIVSANEGILPSLSTGSSFIPFSLREAFSLPTINHQESIYSYHFFRLLHRAENVTFLFNSNSEGMRTGEMSRFLTQMKYDSSLKPDFTSLRFDIKIPLRLSRTLKRSSEHDEQLKNNYLDHKNSSILSPTAINTWIKCSMRFYYRYVCRLKEPASVSAEIDPAVFGNILHGTMKKLYIGFKGNEMTHDTLERLNMDSDNINRLIEDEINTFFPKENNNIISGNELIIKEVIRVYVNQILTTDTAITPFIIKQIEDDFGFDLEIELYNSDRIIRLGGIIDRIDEVKGVTRIVDYKTGGTSGKISSVEDLFGAKIKKDNDGWLQALLYCEAYLRSNPSKIVRPSIYRIKELAGEEFTEMLRIGNGRGQEIRVENYEEVRAEYMTYLTDTVRDIFNEEKSFEMTDVLTECKYCPYNSLCMR